MLGLLRRPRLEAAVSPKSAPPGGCQVPGVAGGGVAVLGSAFVVVL